MFFILLLGEVDEGVDEIDHTDASFLPYFVELPFKFPEFILYFSIFVENCVCYAFDRHLEFFKETCFMPNDISVLQMRYMDFEDIFRLSVLDSS